MGETLFLSWIVSVPVLQRSTISFPCNLGLYFLPSLVSFLRFKHLAHFTISLSGSLVRFFVALLGGGGGGVPSSFGFS